MKTEIGQTTLEIILIENCFRQFIEYGTIKSFFAPLLIHHGLLELEDDFEDSEISQYKCIRLSHFGEKIAKSIDLFERIEIAGYTSLVSDTCAESHFFETAKYYFSFEKFTDELNSRGLKYIEKFSVHYMDIGTS